MYKNIYTFELNFKDDIDVRGKKSSSEKVIKSTNWLLQKYSTRLYIRPRRLVLFDAHGRRRRYNIIWRLSEYIMIDSRPLARTYINDAAAAVTARQYFRRPSARGGPPPGVTGPQSRNRVIINTSTDALNVIADAHSPTFRRRVIIIISYSF